MMEPAAPALKIESPDAIFGQTWAERKGLNTPPPAWAMAQRDPCPICGHPTSDCTSEGAHRG